MTARDAATEADPTDQVEPAATSTEPAATEAGGTTDDATPDRTVGTTDGTTDGTPDGTTDDTDDTTATPSGRRGRRLRRSTPAVAGGPDTPDAPDTPDSGTGKPPRTRRRWPTWLVVALLVVSALFAGAGIVLYTVARPAPVAGVTSSQQAALDAASQAAVNLQTFRRASFDQDFANALASLTPQFAQEQLAPRKDALKQQLSSGGRDATATALSAGLVSSTSSQAVVLVVTNTTQTADDGTSTPFVFSRLQLSLQRVNGKWLVSDLKSVGLS